MRQVRKDEKSGKEAISRAERKHYETLLTVCESRRSVKYYRNYKFLTLAYAAGEKQACTSSFTDTKPSRSKQRSFIAFHLLNLINHEWKLLLS